MTSEFEAELERGKDKLSELHKKEESGKLAAAEQSEAAREQVFTYLGLNEFPALKEWPQEMDEPEQAVLKRFVEQLKAGLPKILPYVEELCLACREVDEASLSDMTRTPFGQYLYTDFIITAHLCIPGFSAIKVRWEGQFHRDIQMEAQDFPIQLIYSCEKSYPETKTIYWEDETDWDVLLAKAQKQCDPVTHAKTKGFLALK
jgi:hypothetical protein